MAAKNVVKAIQAEIQSHKSEVAKLQSIITTLENVLTVMTGKTVKGSRGRPKGAAKGKRGRPKGVKITTGKRGRPKKVAAVKVVAESAAPAVKAPKKKRKMSAEQKKKLSESMRLRWAEWKAK